MRVLKLAGLAMMCAAAMASPAWAGDPPASGSQSAQQAPGPLVLEKAPSGFLVAPEVRIGVVDDKVGTFVGGYAGWLAGNSVFVGAGGYWLANQPNGIRMAYGGAVLGWLAPSDKAVRFGARTLVGVGTARLSSPDPWPQPLCGVCGSRPDYDRMGYLVPPVGRYSRHETFFVLEPQADIVFKLTDFLSVNLGAGYRLATGTRDADRQLRGASGSVAIRLGAGS